jgi:methionyl-tRNA synthetase
MAKYIVTIAPPTPNGNLHLGHISGPFLAADIFYRIRKLKNDEAILLCYSDDYQDYVVRKAMQTNRERFELATHFADRIDATLKKTNIHCDWFLKAYQNQFYKDAIVFFYKQAAEKGVLGEREFDVPYSEEDNVYGYEAFARGTCNYCGEESDPSQCEACANSPVIEKMGPLTSILSKKELTTRKLNREYINLEKYAAYLKKNYEQNPVRKELHEYVHNVLNNCDLNWFIDRPESNGIDVAVNGEQKIIHTWFSGLAGYYGATKEYAQHIGKPELHDYFWKSEDTKIVNFLGFDCSFSHAIVYPSLLSNADGHTHNVIPITNRFLKLEGGDFSTSRGHAIWVDDILEEVSSDSLRYYLALVSPEEQVENFEIKKFNAWREDVFQPFCEMLELYMEAHAQDFAHAHFSNANIPAIATQYKKEWNSYTETTGFSITGIAQTLHKLLVEIQTALENGQIDMDPHIALYLVSGQPVHPELSEKLINKYSINEKEIIDWLLSPAEQVSMA